MMFSYTCDPKTGKPELFAGVDERADRIIQAWENDPDRPILVRDIRPIIALLTEIRDLLQAGRWPQEGGDGRD